MKVAALLAIGAIVSLSACETTNLASKATTPATIHQEFVRHSVMLNWEGTYVYGIGRLLRHRVVVRLRGVRHAPERQVMDARFGSTPAVARGSLLT
jgi:hypothetical protein